jgi:hypothetical protein
MIPQSILAHGIGGAVLLFLFLSIVIYFPKLQGLDIYRGLVLLSLISIVMTLHSISHLGIEKEYKYFPFYSWGIKDKLTGRCPMMNNCRMMHRCHMKKI